VALGGHVCSFVFLRNFNAVYCRALTVWLVNAYNIISVQYIVLPKHRILVLENVVTFTCFGRWAWFVVMGHLNISL